jgi:hypothetical protein
MKFDNINLASGISGARDGQGLKKNFTHYVTDSKYGISTKNNAATVDEDYYIVYNNWPKFTGATRNSDEIDTSSTDLAGIGISSLRTQIGTTHVAATSLDCVIVRKSDRKAVRITITGTNRAHYEDINVSESSTTITAIDPSDGPRTPETGRLINLGYA